MRPDREAPSGLDPLDIEIEERVPPAPRRSWLPRRHHALGLNPVTAPAVVYVPLGYLAGPAGLGLVSAPALGYLDPVVSVALAALGTLAGLAAGDILRHPRLAAVSAVEAGATLLLVTGVVASLLYAWGVATALPPLLLALCLGLGASPSSAPALVVEHPAAKVADLDDLVPILGAAGLLAAIGPGPDAWLLLLATAAIGVSVGIVAALLLRDGQPPSERVVVVVGLLLLLGGAAAYAAVSPLAAGFAAGAWWRWRARDAGQVILADLRRLHHPLVVLFLIVAGATSVLSTQALWLSAALVLSRLLGKLAGGWLGSRVAGGVAPAGFGLLLLPPGVFGLAVVLNAQQVLGPGAMTAALSATAVSTVVFEVVGVAAPHEGEP
ncbi:MAG: hypothetical protein KBA95_03740 [Acidobacteria bacterium]|nr:hypothetical protein [Acidobacteriota bacterium]